MNLTSNEIEVLEAFDYVLTHYTHGEGITAKHEIWSCWIGENTKTLKGKSLSGVMSSLAQKGLIECYWDEGDVTFVTESGVDAFKELKGTTK